MKIVFMGTPVFSLACLEALIEAGHEVAAVFTQPDKPKNRGKQVMTTPVKECALKHGIPVYQPLSLRRGEDAETSMNVLREIGPECIVVVAYGQLLPREVLELPKHGCINVHASLLPKYRGAAPIQRAIQNGETVSGVTTMYMAEGLDTGDMILKQEVAIPEDMTGAQLHDSLSECGAALIVRTLAEVENGAAPRIPQEGETCYASMISKEELKLDFTKPAKQVYDFIRAMSDSPCAYTVLDGKRMKVFMSRLVKNVSAPAGAVADADNFTVACGDGNGVAFTEVQPEGGRRMDIAAYLRGKKPEKGTILG